MSTGLTFYWLQTRKALFFQIEKQVKLLLDFQFSLDFVDFDEKSSTFGFKKIMRIDRTVLNPSDAGKIAKGKFVGDLYSVFLR